MGKVESRGSYRMIAIDLDGTLLSPRGDVTPRVRAAVHKCLKAGLLVCFATGRNWTESRTILDAVEHYDSAVFVGGALVLDTRNRVTLHRTMMDPRLARELCALIEEADEAALVLQDRGTAGHDYLISADLPIHPATRGWLDASENTYRLLPARRLASHDHAHTVRIGVVAEGGQIERLSAAVRERFGERVFFHAIHVPQQGVKVLELFDPSVNKWEGILHVARRHGIAAHEVIAIGDDVNDIHMIRNAGLGVAMGNARPEIKAIAGRVIGANADEGLAEFLEELVATHVVEPMREGEAAA